jgi:hypothetical protein
MPHLNLDDPIPNSRLKMAINSLPSLLGKECTNALIEIIYSRGIAYDDRTSSSLREISNILISLFGEDASSVITYFIWKQLAKEGIE